MKKILILLLLLCGDLYALERESTLKMYHQIFSALSPDLPVMVYTHSKEYRKVFSFSKTIALTGKIKEADIVLVTEQKRLRLVLKQYEKLGNRVKKPLLFVTDYRLLEQSEKAIGAFYWRKGRAQLLFIEERLDAHNITLPRSYQKFTIDAL